jgi:RNA polymerase sigma factor (TIGR02999 family)
MSPGNAEMTQILDDLVSGAPGTDMATLLQEVYPELRALSGAYLGRKRGSHTLQATALVHEAYLRLAGKDARFASRAHFFRVAAKTMRRILINYEERRSARKRRPGRERVALEEVSLLGLAPGMDLLAVEEALARLAELDPFKAQVVELRFFAGCSIEETAAAMETSTASVERAWRFARAWLKPRLDESDAAP